MFFHHGNSKGVLIGYHVISPISYLPCADISVSKNPFTSMANRRRRLTCSRDTSVSFESCESSPSLKKQCLSFQKGKRVETKGSKTEIKEETEYHHSFKLLEDGPRKLYYTVCQKPNEKNYTYIPIIRKQNEHRKDDATKHYQAAVDDVQWISSTLNAIKSRCTKMPGTFITIVPDGDNSDTINVLFNYSENTKEEDKLLLKKYCRKLLMHTGKSPKKCEEHIEKLFSQDNTSSQKIKDPDEQERLLLIEQWKQLFILCQKNPKIYGELLKQFKQYICSSQNNNFNPNGRWCVLFRAGGQDILLSGNKHKMFMEDLQILVNHDNYNCKKIKESCNTTKCEDDSSSMIEVEIEEKQLNSGIPQLQTEDISYMPECFISNNQSGIKGEPGRFVDKSSESASYLIPLSAEVVSTEVEIDETDCYLSVSSPDELICDVSPEVISSCALIDKGSYYLCEPDDMTPITLSNQ